MRLSGAPGAVAGAASIVGGEEIDGSAFWRELRDQTLDYFVPANNGDAALWRLSVPSTAPWTNLPGEPLVEWGGALRWLIAREPSVADAMRSFASQHGGHATLYRGRDKSAGAFQPLPGTLVSLHRRLKDVFDPRHVLNRGRLIASF